MVPDIAKRTQQPLLFPIPERDPDGPSGLDAQGLEDSYGFERDNTASAVIGSARCARPGIEMTAEHDDFRFEGGISAGDLGNDVVPGEVLVVEFCITLELDGDGQPIPGETFEAKHVFLGYFQARQRGCRLVFLPVADETLDEDRSIPAAAVAQQGEGPAG